MTDISSRVDLSSVRAITDTLKAVPLAEAPEELFQQVMNAEEDMLELKYSDMPSTAGNPTYAGYANVFVKNKIVAQIDNHGWVQSSNALGGNISSAIAEADDEAGVLSGPLLAQARAEKIAEKLGGSVVKLSTAMSQGSFDSTPQPKATVNRTALEKDPLFAQLEKIKQAHTAFLAQQIGQEQEASESGASTQIDAFA